MRILKTIEERLPAIENIAGKTLNEITSELKIDKADACNVRHYLKKRNIKYLPSNRGYPNLYPFLEEYKEKGDSVSLEYYADKYDCKVQKVKGMLSRANIVKRSEYVASSRSKPPIQFTEVDKQVILGSLLGDGSVSGYTKGHDNSRLSIQHSEAQFDYLRYKESLLSCKTSSHTAFIVDKRPEWKNHWVMSVRTSENVAFNQYRDRWYGENGKFVCRKDFDTITGLGLAIWIMDDGSRTTDGSISIATMSFCRDDVEYIQYRLREKFNILITIHADNNIRVSKASFPLIKELTLPYFHESMLYKFGASKMG